MASIAPTLTEILLDDAPPPWTLDAFMVYLSQNHCMETLEFTLDSERYAAVYSQFAAENSPSLQSTEQVCRTWEKLMRVYVVPRAPRQINIPSRVRDQLLNLPSRDSPPHPSKLNEANRAILELMNDSLLVPFVQSVAPDQVARASYDPACSRSRHSNNTSERGLDQPAKALVYRRIVESERFLGSGSNSPALVIEPMAVPTTPPTTEYAFHTSPCSSLCAKATHKTSWKKLRARLSFGRRFWVRPRPPFFSNK